MDIREKKGDIVEIINSKMNGDRFIEGFAKLISKCNVSYADNLWNVEFENEKGQTYKRFIYSQEEIDEVKLTNTEKSFNS